VHGDNICFIDDKREDDFLGGRSGQQFLTNAEHGADDKLKDVDVHELNMVLELAASTTDALGEDYLSYMFLLFSEDIENDAMDEWI
jgi:hypothetical protein